MVCVQALACYNTNNMGDRLEYSFHSEGKGHGVQRKGALEIATTKKVVDYITSGRGAMLDETRSTAREKVIDRVYGDNGEVVLRFDLDSLGRGYGGQPERNSSRAFDIIAQVEGVAAQEGWSDTRLQVFYRPAQGRRLDDFFVSFERPVNTDDVELANRLQAAMWDAARFLRYYPFAARRPRAYWRFCFSRELVPGACRREQRAFCATASNASR